MEITYKVAMRQTPAHNWVIMDAGTEKAMRTALNNYKKALRGVEFRLEKHTMEVLDA